MTVGCQQLIILCQQYNRLIIIQSNMSMHHYECVVLIIIVEYNNSSTSKTHTHTVVQACMAGVKAGCAHLCRVAGNTV